MNPADMKYTPYHPFYSVHTAQTLTNKCQLITFADITPQYRKILRDDVIALADYLIASNRRRLRWEENCEKSLRVKVRKLLQSIEGK